MSPLAIVIGATGTIGSAVATRLWQEGYSLIVTGKTTKKVITLFDRLRATKQAGQGIAGIPLNVTRRDDWWELRSTIKHDLALGATLDLLVACHSATPAPGPAIDAYEDTRSVFETDVMGALKACQVAASYMLPQQCGSIVLVSSLHARQTYPERVPYAVAKSAICGLARALAVEWGRKGVRVNYLLPWQVAGQRSTTFMEQAKIEGYDLEEAYRQRSPMRRLIQPEEVADAVLFLARNAAMNGCELVMDGGVSSSMWYKGFTEGKDYAPTPPS